MKLKPGIFIGITSWNSELFLSNCINSILKNTNNDDLEITVFDNSSKDGSVAAARALGANIIVGQCSQKEALNNLVSRSRSELTLLIHADVILLNHSWLSICTRHLVGDTALVSPEDIGCGPLTRPFGVDKPESSFMLFRTDALSRLRQLRWRRKWKLPLLRREVDFDGAHITHNLPSVLEKAGYSWRPMAVHWSDQVDEPIWTPDGKPHVWSDELGRLRYGLGNFYSLDGVVTHYHNWYDRRVLKVHGDTVRVRSDFPADYVNAYTEAFLRDYVSNSIVIPSAELTKRKPAAL
jgi:glycosyltransferase involved in cell wall biosynthesis